MTSGPGMRAALATALAVAAALSACGFSDTLTSRGFVKQGDQICVDTLVRTGVGLRSGEDVPPPEFLGALASTYGDAAARFQRLEVRTEDQETRDRVVDEYSSFSNRLQRGSKAAARGADAEAESGQVFSDISSQQEEMKTYGFDVCGGGGGAQGSPRQ
jgi:hypothetical protein